MFYKAATIKDMNTIDGTLLITIEFSFAAFKSCKLKSTKIYQSLKTDGYLDWVCNPSRTKVIEYLNSKSIPWGLFNNAHTNLINNPYDGTIFINIVALSRQPLDKQHYKIKMLYKHLQPDNKGRCRIAGVRIRTLSLNRSSID